MAGASLDCPQCSAAAADDQRYCLSCGGRLADRGARDPATLLAGRATAPAAVARRSPSRPLPRESRRVAIAGMALLTAGAVLGAALGPAPPGTLAAPAEQIVVVMTPAPAPAPAPSPPESPPPVEAPAAPVPPSVPASPPVPVSPPVPLPAPPPSGVPAQSDEPGQPAEPAAPEPESVGHLFLVVLPGAGYPSSYLRDELGPRGALLTRYSAVGLGALANRIGLVSGRAPTPSTELGCPAGDCLYPAETKTLADQLSTYGLEWRAYAGTEPERACTPPDPSNPFLYFHSLIDLSDCSRSLAELDRLERDLGAVKRTPVLSYITPDRAADAVASEALLRRWIPAILRSPAYREDGLIAITFDSAPADGTEAVLLSPFVRRGTSSDRAYDHYDLLRTTQDLLGFEALGLAAEARGFGKDVFESSLDLHPDERL